MNWKSGWEVIVLSFHKVILNGGFTFISDCKFKQFLSAANARIKPIIAKFKPFGRGRQLG
ncbi:hypothetical protein TH53_23150 [Pedobacter lusitanus]|uniref:Uncharacterized protein n=1 Tax=Pedobacter lusitanus TaxID=1503925 RepID=A0A0D0GCE7_9SPHI|nr:hypothetical protein TH53_23150 [Pedobacter lusitanus]